MTGDRVCAQRGLLVDGDTRLLTDPSEYFHEGVRVHVGCERLRCANCESWVRAGPPGLGLKDHVRFDVRTLYAATEWSALPFIEQRTSLHSPVRLYACKCRC